MLIFGNALNLGLYPTYNLHLVITFHLLFCDLVDNAFVLANAIETCIPPVLRKKTLWISYGRAFKKISFYVRCVFYPILSPKILYVSKSCLLTSHAREDVWGGGGVV